MAVDSNNSGTGQLPSTPPLINAARPQLAKYATKRLARESLPQARALLTTLYGCRRGRVVIPVLQPYGRGRATDDGPSSV